MSETRRDFLKVTGIGAAAVSGALTGAPPAAAAGEPPHAFEMPRNMTLLTMRRDGGGYGLGVKTDKGILDVAQAAQALSIPAPADMDDLLQKGKGGILRALVDAAVARGPQAAFLKEEAVQFGPAVTRPEKIIMMGFNYRKHAEETGTSIPKNPVLFNKYGNALNHHGGTIKLPSAVASEFDYEVELVMVFGKEARNVSEQDALDYVAGYCTGNDFSARDLQRLTSQFMIGKTCDGFAPLGAYLVTSDIVGEQAQARDARQW